MPRTPLDPARLSGDALNRWFRRSPDEIETERRARDDERYNDFFSGAQAQGPGSGHPGVRTLASEDDALWVTNGYGGYRRIGPGGEDPLAPGRSNDRGDGLPNNPASPEGFQQQEIGNPHNPRLKREHIAKHGAWPQTPEGRDYDVSHIVAIADGGTNTLDNIEPMHPDEHKAKHRDDAGRWSKRHSIARAFGGKVEPPAHAPKRRGGPTVRGLGLLGLLPNLTGILSGRIRSDTPVHFWNDLLGYSSEDDLPRNDLRL